VTEHVGPVDAEYVEQGDDVAGQRAGAIFRSMSAVRP
jgi:hypothetical protein